MPKMIINFTEELNHRAEIEGTEEELEAVRDLIDTDATALSDYCSSKSLKFGSFTLEDYEIAE